jgi:hypothetical protein
VFAALALVSLAAPRRAVAADLYLRPKFQVAVGLGASIDRNSPNPRPDQPLTAFFFTAGLGDGLWGFDLRSFANGATKVQVTRLSFELVGVLRPFASVDGDDYGRRVLRLLAADAGLALERVSLEVDSDWRRGLVIGAHGDLPIGRAGVPKELRLRLGVRRMLGTHGSVTSIDVADSAVELYGQMAFVF